MAAQAPLLAGALVGVCGRPIQFVSSDYEISVPGAPRPACVELPCSTKLHVLPLSPAAVRGMWQGRGTARPPDCEAGWPWPGGPSPPVGHTWPWPWCPASCHSTFACPRNGRGPAQVTGAGPSLSCASVSPLLPGVPLGSHSMEWQGLCPISGVGGDFGIIYGLPPGSGSRQACVPTVAFNRDCSAPHGGAFEPSQMTHWG